MKRGVALVVEDDDDIRTALVEVLRQAGFAVHTACSGAEAVEVAKGHNPDIVTMDVALPDFDGLEASRRIRAFSNAYLIIISGKADEADTLLGFEAGADDYLTKPFRPRELRARINAMLSRPKSFKQAHSGIMTSATSSEGSNNWKSFSPSSDDHAQPIPALTSQAFTYAHKGLTLHEDSRQVLVNGVQVDLTRTQFDILLCLFENGRTVRTKAALVRRLRNEPFDTGSFVSPKEERALEVHVANLRKRLGDTTQYPKWVETVRGVGYRMTL